MSDHRKRWGLSSVWPIAPATSTATHQEGVRPGFTKKYGVKQLVWFENHDTREGAKARERRIKEWKRRWKIELIESVNPRWEDLGEQLNDLLAF
jgi:putative endonuclease